MTENQNRPTAANSEAIEELSTGSHDDSTADVPAPSAIPEGQEPLLRTWDAVIECAADDLIRELGTAIREKSPRELADSLLVSTRVLAIKWDLDSASRVKTKLHHLPFVQTARLMLAVHDIVKVALVPTSASSSGMSLLGVYQSTGADEGIYATAPNLLRRMVRGFVPTAPMSYVAEVLEVLMQEAPEYAPTREANLVPVANGVFDWATEELLPFSKDWIFLRKSPVRYVKDAPMPKITHPLDGTQWDPETGIASLSDDPEIVELLWELISMSLRPYNDWGMFPLLFARSGNNGKGFLIKLMRLLVGDDGWSGVNLKDLGEKFLPPELLTASAVLTDENPTNVYLDNVANFKAMVTGDGVSFERKGVDKFSIILRLVVIMAFNALPRVSDRSGSWIRRLLPIPMSASFEGIERKYIKQEYIHREEVQEYVLWRALHMRHTQLSMPQVCIDLRHEYEVGNDIVSAFWDEFKDQFVWDGLPWGFLYDLFVSWHRRVMPSSKGAPSEREFKTQIVDIVRKVPEWDCTPTKGKPELTGTRFKSKPNMTAIETLVGHYNLERWADPGYPGGDIARRSIGHHEAMYYGLKRTAIGVAAAAASTTNQDED